MSEKRVKELEARLLVLRAIALNSWNTEADERWDAMHRLETVVLDLTDDLEPKEEP